MDSLCPTCFDLQATYLVLPRESLETSITNGCKACLVLKKAISLFVSLNDVHRIVATVDCALYLIVSTQDSSFVVELFSEAGCVLSSTHDPISVADRDKESHLYGPTSGQLGY